VGSFSAGDPDATIPYDAPSASPLKSTALYLNVPSDLPTGSTVTLSVDDTTDIRVYDGDPNSTSTDEVLGADSSSSRTWTVGSDTVPQSLTVLGASATDFQKVHFTLAATPAVKVVGLALNAPPAPAGAAVSKSTPATVPGKGGYLEAFDGTWDFPNNTYYNPPRTTAIVHFRDDYKGTAVDYHAGVGNGKDHPINLAPWTWPNIAVDIYSGIFGGLESAVQLNKAWDSLVSFYKDPSHAFIPVDIIGYSRGAFVAANLANRITSRGITILRTLEVPYRTGFRQVKVYDTIHPWVRFVGLISPVKQMGPFSGNWPTKLPAGVGATYEALDNVPSGIYLQTPITAADGTDPGITYDDDHPSIGVDPLVLTDLETAARAAGVPI
jgi:hypothetical protein